MVVEEKWLEKMVWKGLDWELGLENGRSDKWFESNLGILAKGLGDWKIGCLVERGSGFWTQKKA